jgi:hypothetical protein
LKKQNHILYEYNSTLFAITFFTTRIINYSYYFFIKDDFNRKLELYNVGPYELGIINMTVHIFFTLNLYWGIKNILYVMEI